MKGLLGKGKNETWGGMARRALTEALNHVKKRVQFGKPLAAQQ